MCGLPERRCPHWAASFVASAKSSMTDGSVRGAGNLRDGLDMHSWRHTFKSKVRKRRHESWSEEAKFLIMGHTDKKVASNYGEFEPAELQRLVDLIRY
jgi:hypothetical protein